MCQCDSDRDHGSLLSSTIHANGGFLAKESQIMQTTAYFRTGTQETRSAQDCVSQIPLRNHVSVVVSIFLTWATAAIADQRRGTVPPQLTRRDFAAAQALAKQIAALSPSARPEEARRLAECAYATAHQLRRDYGVIWPPLFNNVLVNSGIRKRGLCFQWAEDLLVVLDRLRLISLELHWGEADVGTWQESNCVVVTAKGQLFNTGIILDGWRHSGRLYWRAVATDKVSWVENKTYAHFVRAKLATADNHDLVVQSGVNAK